jgi:hypothetical protein
MRISINGIRRGKDRNAARISLRKLGSYFRSGVSGERVRQIEADDNLSGAIRRDYVVALRVAIAARDRMRAALQNNPDCENHKMRRVGDR